MSTCRTAYLLCLISLVLTLTGCAATLQPTSPLPDNFSVKRIAQVDAGAPFAVSKRGQVAAVSDNSLQLIELSGGAAHTIAPGTASLLAFSPGGERLAAAFVLAEGTALKLYDLQGKVTAETVVPTRLTALAWRTDRDLLAAGLDIKRFRFGTELISLLFRWDGSGAPQPTALSDITVRPQVGAMADALLYQTVKLAVSPYGDEIAYYVLKDPPMFLPYLRVAVRHLDTAAEVEVAEVGVGSGGPLYTPDSGSILAGDYRSLTRRFSLTESKETGGWPVAGNNLALSPSGSYLFADGRLYLGDRELTSFAKETVGEFLADGSGLVIGYKNGLFLVSGLTEPKRPQPPADLTRMLELRRLRAQKLISDQEYKAQKAKVPSL